LRKAIVKYEEALSLWRSVGDQSGEAESLLGKEIKGEGLAGLTRGVMYAGTPRVIASLWNVRAEATAELMKRFYRNMLIGKCSPAAALREAQISMWREPRWAATYYWAVFVLQGEWN
jgi:CHAT domain-containing protein